MATSDGGVLLNLRKQLTCEQMEFDGCYCCLLNLMTVFSLQFLVCVWNFTALEFDYDTAFESI